MKKFSLIFLLGAIAVGGIGTIARATLLSSSTTKAQASETVTKLAQASGANADDTVDLKALSCRELLKTDGEERANLMIFMHGFMSGKKGNLTINGPALAEASDKIIDGCIDNPKEKLITLFEKNR